MIFVTVGTQPQPFKRLFEKLESLVSSGIIKEKVIAQVGTNVIQNSNIQTFDYLPLKEMYNYMNSADLIISHGGTGSIITALKMGKKVIGIPRLSEYGEHINNHQVDLITILSREKHIIPLFDIDLMENAIAESKNFVPVPFKSGQDELISDIRLFINE
ncbi:beta(1,3)galactosyltransferase EpsH [Bacteroides caecigallinarum]|uniref:PssE/Cps14G family polysaccharide biosynthesis glycosyltransferase n=1 Tax=Bacteroides caecigallinarum TaxID=1411144 RepID=UPI0019575F6D|nr:PssE/Cps14G family polysaccharide biosynthesis glycosyltransferase [Bacteroides caecigallinarum]MBM6962071.1 beta(1,3)galactosyltransferase EpsH [Bacteroides caecigallinarum]